MKNKRCKKHIGLRARIRAWILRKLHAVPKTDYDELHTCLENTMEENNSILKLDAKLARQNLDMLDAQVCVSADMDVRPALGYTPENIRRAGYAQMCYLLGTKVYPYAEYSIVDNTYSCKLQLTCLPHTAEIKE